MTIPLPKSWPKCDPWCGQLGAGWNGRCRWHGGLDIPEGDWAVLYTRTGVYLWNRADKSMPKTRVSWMIASILIERGKATSALFSTRGGESMLTRLERKGVTVKPVLIREGMREYAFERAS